MKWQVTFVTPDGELTVIVRVEANDPDHAVLVAGARVLLRCGDKGLMFQFQSAVKECNL